MADAKVQIGLSSDFLEGTSVNTPAGNNLFREGVVISDPETPDGRVRVLTDVPGQTEKGLVVRTVNRQEGAWNYAAGIQGTPTLPEGARIIQIALAAGLTPASMTINGGDSITVPANQALTIEPKGNLVAPTLIFTSTASYFVEFVL